MSSFVTAVAVVCGLLAQRAAVASEAGVLSGPIACGAALEGVLWNLTEPTWAQGAKPFPQWARRIIGRETEADRILAVLARDDKNKVILSGMSGVGKTSVVMEVARRLREPGGVLPVLEGTQIFRVSFDQLARQASAGKTIEVVAKKLEEIVRWAAQNSSRVVLFFDPIDPFLGNGDPNDPLRQSLMPIISSAFSDPSLRIILEVQTPAARALLASKEPVLWNASQPIEVQELDLLYRRAALKDVVERLATRFRVEIPTKVVESALGYADRFHTNFIKETGSRGAAEALLEAAAQRAAARAYLRVGRERAEARLALLRERKGELERLAPGASSGAAQKELKSINDEMFRLETSERELQATAESARQMSSERTTAEAKLRELDRIQAPSLEQRAERAKLIERLSELQQSSASAVTIDDVKLALSELSYAPPTLIDVDFRERIQNLEANLNERVRGQASALAEVSLALRTIGTPIHDAGKPLGSFLMLGPTGVGKTETAKALAEFLFGDASLFTVIDMANYMDKFSISRLIGAPAGYVGYEEGGELTNAVRKRPMQVVLLDELEKAHPDVFNALLSVLDEGRLVDSQGRVVDFRNTVVVATSNVGAATIAALSRETDPEERQRLQHEFDLSLRTAFRPEFLGRWTARPTYGALDRALLEEIAGMRIRELFETLASDWPGVEFEAPSPELLAWVVERSGVEHAQSGARPLKVTVRTRVGDPLIPIYERLHHSGRRVRIRVSVFSPDATNVTIEEEFIKN